mmetsp:Transcript_69960/g.161838  ORF Transcript_69960/g.161838 Transcript_69960/m.161838 type:complete len:313 (+) Transcript_69960:108-1046(+)
MQPLLAGKLQSRSSTSRGKSAVLGAGPRCTVDADTSSSTAPTSSRLACNTSSGSAKSASSASSSTSASADSDSSGSADGTSSFSVESSRPLSSDPAVVSLCFMSLLGVSASTMPRTSSCFCSLESPSCPDSTDFVGRSAALSFARKAFFSAVARLRSSSSANCFSKFSALSWHKSSSASRSSSFPLLAFSRLLGISGATWGALKGTHGGSAVTTLLICSRWRSITLRRNRSRTLLPSPSWPARHVCRCADSRASLGDGHIAAGGTPAMHCAVLHSSTLSGEGSRRGSEHASGLGTPATWCGGGCFLVCCGGS